MAGPAFVHYGVLPQLGRHSQSRDEKTKVFAIECLNLLSHCAPDRVIVEASMIPCLLHLLHNDDNVRFCVCVHAFCFGNIQCPYYMCVTTTSVCVCLCMFAVVDKEA